MPVLWRVEGVRYDVGCHRSSGERRCAGERSRGFDLELGEYAPSAALAVIAGGEDSATYVAAH